VRIDPELTANPRDDADAEARVLKAIGSAGLNYRTNTSSTRQEWAQFDFGVTDAIVKALVAAGSAGAIASALKNGRGAWEAWLKHRSTRELKVTLPDKTELAVRDSAELEQVLAILDARAKGRPVPPPPEGTPGEY
jgi:hypothetical protein